MNWPKLLTGLGALYTGGRTIKNAIDESRQERRGTNQAELADGKDGMPKMTVHKVRSIEERVSYIIDKIQKGKLDPRVHAFARGAVTKKCGDRDWCIAERDWKGEQDAIFAAVRDKVRYTLDPAGVDMFMSAKNILRFNSEDCLPAGTLLLTDKMELVPIEKLLVGQRIWGRDAWTEVKDVGYKGVKSVDAIQLNNGSWFKATPEHKVYVALCHRHVNRDNSSACGCPVDDREVVRLPVSELTPDMVLIAPDRIPFGTEEPDIDRTLVEGFYIADGWSSWNNRFEIAGRDGKPKEAQKRLIEEVCARLGVRTTLHKKHISIFDAEWTLRVHQMGKRAPEKHALSINLGEGAAAALLRGLMADADVREGTFTTTSRALAMQVRMLHKMFGVTCGEAYIEEHGGLGTHPIWRFRPRRLYGEKAPKLLRVRSLERTVGERPVYDLTTADHYVYLPEADVTVSNCDGMTIILGSSLQAIGHPVQLPVYWLKGAKSWGHISLYAGLPPQRPSKWRSLDASMPEPPGWEVPRAHVKKKLVFKVPE